MIRGTKLHDVITLANAESDAMLSFLQSRTDSLTKRISARFP